MEAGLRLTGGGTLSVRSASVSGSNSFPVAPVLPQLLLLSHPLRGQTLLIINKESLKSSHLHMSQCRFEK